ncbi:hypothetical protein D3C87_1787470 [compost metagenome]
MQYRLTLFDDVSRRQHHLAGRHRQGAVFHRIGRKFVQHEPEADGLVGAELHLVLVQFDLVRIDADMRHQLLGDQVREPDRAPLVIR